jgi:hypothetical protein
MKKHKKLIYTGVIVFCAISLFFFLRGKDTISAFSVARIYEIPKDALIVMDVREQEEAALRDETESHSKDTRQNVAVIAAYEIVPKVPFTFYPVRIVITTLDKFPDHVISGWQQFEEAKRQKEKASERLIKLILKYEKLFLRHREEDGSESGVYSVENAVMSTMRDDGSFSTAVTTNPAFIFENHNAKKKYSIRIIQSVLIPGSLGGIVELKPIKGAKKYFSEWHYHKDPGFLFPLELAERVDFNHIFNSLRDATINHIEETGVVEKFYAKRAAEKTQQPQAPKP